MTETIETESSAGVPLVVEVSEDEIRAFRKKEPDVSVASQTKSKAELKQEAEKVKNLFKGKPVMTIRKRGEDEFSVDFEAGFQRGEFSTSKEGLTEELKMPMYGGADIEWNTGVFGQLGIDESFNEVDEFLSGTKDQDHEKSKKVS